MASLTEGRRFSTFRSAARKRHRSSGNAQGEDCRGTCASRSALGIWAVAVISAFILLSWAFPRW